MAGIGHGGQYAPDAGGIGAVVEDAAQVRNLQAVGVGLENIIGAKAVNGDQQKRAAGESPWRQNERQNRQEEKAGITPHGAIVTPGAGFERDATGLRSGRGSKPTAHRGGSRRA